MESSGKHVATNTIKDLELAFDVSHGSIGWAVLKAGEQPVNSGTDKTGMALSETASVARLQILGCGVVAFPSEDCLASKRRHYRRQRRRTRATRQRIARMEKLLIHMRVFSPEQLEKKHRQAGGHPAPWLLAARVIASRGAKNSLLNWNDLWDVLRWYAHNRGYDRNRLWRVDDFETDAAETARVRTANALMKKYRTGTMAETVCEALEVPLAGKQSSNRNFKCLNAAFPRQIVENEVRLLLNFHQEQLPGINETLIKTILEDWRAAQIPELKLPARYRGGLLFGQLPPRFQNRNISRCPITGEKVPSKNCWEYHRFRWAMMLASIRIAGDEQGDLRLLTPEERNKINKAMESEGSLTPAEFKKLICQTTACFRHNVDVLLMQRRARGALTIEPVATLIRNQKWAALWHAFSPRVQKRARDLWHRGKSVTIETLFETAKKLGEPLDTIETTLERLVGISKTRSGVNCPVTSEVAWLKEPVMLKKAAGRAPYARPLLVRAYAQVMAGRDPLQEGGCLFVTEENRQAQLRKPLDEQTNNHLVRHRLLILQRLLNDLIAEPGYGNRDKMRVAKITVEVSRDLLEMAGKNRREIEKILNWRASNHDAVVAKLKKDLSAKTFNGEPIRITGGLIRKARIADDLGWECPYTGQAYDAFDLVSGRVDKNHIIPYSIRNSDSLASFVITFREVIRMKGQRPGLRFVSEEQGKQVTGLPTLTITSLVRFKQWVEDLESNKGYADDQRRRKKRKQLLLLDNYEVKALLPRNLVFTSQLDRFAGQTIQKAFDGFEEAPAVLSLPDIVICEVRRSWNLLSCLSRAAPYVVEADGSMKTKAEIRRLTRLDRALDACILGVASHIFPHDVLWQAMLKREPNATEKLLLRSTGCFDFDPGGGGGLTDLPNFLKDQICFRLAEKRVVQHVSRDMSGMRGEDNTRGLTDTDGQRVFLRQRARDPKTGGFIVKRTEELARKVIGLNPGKLAAQKGARVLTQNFGVAILKQGRDGEEEFVLIPWHKVWHRIQELKQYNGGKPPPVLRIGTFIQIREKTGKRDYRGVWMVRGVYADSKYGVIVDLSSPAANDHCVPGRADCPQHAILQTLYDGGLEILKPTLAGVPSIPENILPP